MPAGIITPTSVRTDWRCNSGTIVATLPETARWTLEQTIENHLVMKRLTLTVPMDAANYDQITVGRVIQLDYRDASTSPATDDWEEYRITDREEDLAAGVATLEAVWWIQDLLERDGFISETVGTETSFTPANYGVTPSNAIGQRVIAALPTYWTTGTVTPTDVIDVAFDRDTPLSGALRIAAATLTRTGTVYELSPRRNGTTGLYLDLTVYGAGTVDARVAKNLAGLRRNTSRRDQGTRIAFDTEAALRRPTYTISAISTNTYIDVTEVNAAAPGPAREDDQWNGYAWIETKNGTSHTITDTVRVDLNTTRLYMSSTSGMATGERGHLYDATGAREVTYVDSPSLQTTYGKRLRVLSGGDGLTNLFPNADLRSGTSTTPTGWSITGTPTRRSKALDELARYGGYSYEVATNFTTIGRSVAVYCTAGEQYTYTIYLLINTIGTGTSFYFTDPNDGSNDTVALDGSVAGLDVPNTWLRYSATYGILTTGVKTFAAQVSRGAPATGVFTFDAILLVAAATEVAFRAGSDAADNVASAHAFLETNGMPVSRYDAELVDLSIDDPRTYAADRPLLGGTLYLTDADLNESRNGLRIVSLGLRSREQAKPRLQLSTLPRRLTSLLAA